MIVLPSRRCCWPRNAAWRRRVRRPSFWRSGAADLEGRLPINTHGGMLSHAHAGATGGLFGSIEAVQQLRGTATGRQVARHEIALVHVEGGIMSNHATMIYGRQPV